MLEREPDGPIEVSTVTTRRSPGSKTAHKPVENCMRTTHTIKKFGAAMEVDSVGTVYRTDDATASPKENKVDED